MKKLKSRLNTYRIVFIAALFFLQFNAFIGLTAQTSFVSLHTKSPKHYFNTIIVLDSYRKPEKELKDTSNALSKRLKSYGIRQFNLSFQVPVFTKDIKVDNTTTENHHVLITGNFMRLRPVFSGIKQHTLTKNGIGVRYIYNTGQKGVWFFDMAPFVTRDRTYPSKPFFRIASTIIYSRNESYWFNWRIGATKSFLWGNRFYLPFIGFRIGRLDKFNVSIQFPRQASLNLPLGSKLILSLYTRSQGGLFNFSNHDSLYFRATDATFHFTRYEINTGFRSDIRVNDRFNFYLSSGFSTRNNITFYSERANSLRPRLPYKTYFFTKNVAPSLFFNFGLVFRLGKTKSYYNNKNIYDAIDLNNAGNNGNAQIPLTPKKPIKNYNLESVQDLIDYTEF